MPDCLEQLLEKRRSIYNLGSAPALDRPELADLIKTAVKQCPSAFNSQSGRIALLFGQAHHRLWNITLDALQKVTPPDKFPNTQAKIASFAAGYGSVLYFIDDNTTRSLQEKFPLYADKFPIWAEQSCGMLQFIVWTLLAEHGIGASLQHYNPLIDDAVRLEFQLPASWRLTAQMPIGSIEAPAPDKTFLPLDERVKIFS